MYPEKMEKQNASKYLQSVAKIQFQILQGLAQAAQRNVDLPTWAKRLWPNVQQETPCCNH